METKQILRSAPLYPVSAQEMIDQISKERMKHMNTELEIMKKQLVHYKKLAKKYLFFKRVLRYGGVAGGTSLEVIAVVLELASIGISTPVSISLMLGGVLTPAFAEGVNKLIDLKRNKYLSKIKHIEEYLNKLYLFTKEAAEDKILSLEELKKFKDILSEFHGKAVNISKIADSDIHNQLKVLMEEISKINKKLKFKV